MIRLTVQICSHIWIFFPEWRDWTQLYSKHLAQTCLMLRTAAHVRNVAHGSFVFNTIILISIFFIYTIYNIFSLQVNLCLVTFYDGSELLEKYNMKKIISVPQSQDMSNDIPETIDHQLRDKKLQKLWKKAEFAGFAGNYSNCHDELKSCMYESIYNHHYFFSKFWFQTGN